MNQPNMLSKVFGRVLSIHPKQVGKYNYVIDIILIPVKQVYG